MSTESSLLSFARELESGMHRPPPGLVTPEGFSSPFPVEIPEEGKTARLVIRSEEARQWAMQLEAVLFNQLSFPFGRKGGWESLAVYRKMSALLKWTLPEEQAFYDFAVSLPQQGGMKAIDPRSQRYYPSVEYVNLRPTLSISYPIEGIDRGMTSVEPSQIQIYFGGKSHASVLIPFREVLSKADAEERLFWDTNPLQVKTYDLRANGGLLYATKQDPENRDRTITFAEMSQVLPVNIGGPRQMWLRTNAGVPGTQKGIEVRAGTLQLAPSFGR